MALNDTELAILELEQTWWKYAAAKEQTIRAKFDISSTRYFQILNALIDRDDALAHAPLLVNRLRRMREGKRGVRTASCG